jgi:hypothetical protein
VIIASETFENPGLKGWMRVMSGGGWEVLLFESCWDFHATYWNQVFLTLLLSIEAVARLNTHLNHYSAWNHGKSLCWIYTGGKGDKSRDFVTACSFYILLVQKLTSPSWYSMSCQALGIFLSGDSMKSVSSMRCDVMPSLLQLQYPSAETSLSA